MFTFEQGENTSDILKATNKKKKKINKYATYTEQNYYHKKYFLSPLYVDTLVKLLKFTNSLW